MEANGIESYVAFGFGYNPKDDEKENVYRIESDRQLFISKLWTKATCHHGFNNKRETRRLLAWIDEIKPDIIHMHNIHIIMCMFECSWNIFQLRTFRVY